MDGGLEINSKPKQLQQATPIVDDQNIKKQEHFN
jgi:hypothetical protein